MNQISLTEILFEQLLSYFENCKRNGERRMNIVIGIDNGIIEFKRLIPELKISIIDPQLNRLFKLSKLILEEWNKEIYQLDKNGELRCIHIHDDYTVSRKNNVIGFDKWSELYPKARMYSLDVLIDFVNDFNGYCAQKFNLELPPQKKEKAIKYNAKECALSYVLDLYSIGNQIPTNRVEGSLDAKLLNKIGAEKIKLLENKLSFKSADSFYRAVKEIIKQDMNKQDTLTAISIDWLGAVKSLSSNWEETEMYLKSKGLIKNIMEK